MHGDPFPPLGLMARKNVYGKLGLLGWMPATPRVPERPEIRPLPNSQWTYDVALLLGGRSHHD